MKVYMALAVLSIALLVCPCAFAQDSAWAVVGKVGTVGVGGDVHIALVPKVLNLRLGVSFFRYTADLTDKDIDYSARLKLGAVPIIADVYPFKNWFRLGGGIVVNLNEFNGTAKPNQGQITINGRSYSADQIGELDAAVKFNRAAPYFGLGFSNPVRKGKHWGFYFDLGAMYHGHPKATLSATKAPSSQFLSDLSNQQQRFNNDAKPYTFWPVIQLGVSYHFGKKH
jgi:hypothetical protein